MAQEENTMELEAAEALHLLSQSGQMEIVEESEQEAAIERESSTGEHRTPSSEIIVTRQESTPPSGASVTVSQVRAAPGAAIQRQQTALQAYLIHQQRLAGIAANKIVMIQGQQSSQPQTEALVGGALNRARPPSIVQITRDGIVVPHIPPAQFNGVVSQLLGGTTQTEEQQASRAITESQFRSQHGNIIANGGDSEVGIITRPRSVLGTLPHRDRREDIHAGMRRASSQGNRLRISQSSEQYALTRLPDRTITNDIQSTVAAGSAPSTTLVVRPKRSRRMRAGLDQDIRGTGNDFNIFHAILRQSELAFVLAKHLRVRDLMSLYAISKDFHNLMNTRFTAMILSQATSKAAQSARIFPFRCYHRLCIEDPARNPHPDLTRADSGENRLVPSFRWLVMVCWRENVVADIMRMMEEDGVRMPKDCALAIKKLWFLMDIPDNARRVGTIQNEELWTDADLFFAALFFVKLDMRFTDPLTGGGRDGMRRLLLAQPSFTLLWKLLRRTALQTHFDTLKAYVRWRYRPMPHEANNHIFGVPPHEVGSLQFEGYGRTGSRVRLQRPDELVLKEAVRRELDMQQKYMDMFLWGYVNPNTIEVDEEQGLLQVREDLQDQPNPTHVALQEVLSE